MLLPLAVQLRAPIRDMELGTTEPIMVGPVGGCWSLLLHRKRLMTTLLLSVRLPCCSAAAAAAAVTASATLSSALTVLLACTSLVATVHSV